TKSGMDWYTAASQLEIFRTQGVPVGSVAQIPYFANLFPSNLAALINQNYCFETCIPTTINGQPTTQTQAVYLMAAADFFGNDLAEPEGWPDTGSGKNLFFNPPLRALAGYGSIAKSRYHSAPVPLPQRL